MRPHKILLQTALALAAFAPSLAAHAASEPILNPTILYGGGVIAAGNAAAQSHSHPVGREPSTGDDVFSIVLVGGAAAFLGGVAAKEKLAKRKLAKTSPG